MLAPHQDEAVVLVGRLLARRGGALLADDVGLGKSFVAAEVVRRWVRRQGSATVIVPAGLVSQWRETLSSFVAEAVVVSHDAIVRQPFMARPGRDLVVVDEAHAFRNSRTLRYGALARRTSAARVLLITATPLCNALGDLQALLRLFARDDLLADAGIPSIDAAFEARDGESVARIVASLVIRRERSVLEGQVAFGALERRVVRHAVPTLNAIGRLRFPLVGSAPVLRLFLHRRLESGNAALAESLRRQRRFYQRAIAALSAGRALPRRDYRRAFAGDEDAGIFQEVLFWELFAPPAAGIDARQLREEIETIDELLGQLAADSDAKRSLLVELVRSEPEPLLIFTGSAATARDLRDAVAPIRRCGLITSRERSREAVIAGFRRGLFDAIVSTDMAAEGLDLQRAGVVIHYDLPWNPARLDQRNGRAHRIGQPREVVRAIYFVPLSDDSGVVAAVARKNRIRKRTFAGVSGPGRQGTLPTLRPRLPRQAAFHRLAAAVPSELPDWLARSHRAGIELLIEEMSREFLDAVRLDHLLAIVKEEP